MFTYLNKQGVKDNDKGFIVQRTGCFASEYSEGARKITIELNNGILSGGKFCEIIKSDSFFKWDDGTLVPTEKQKEMLKNFTEAIEFQGIGVVVDK